MDLKNKTKNLSKDALDKTDKTAICDQTDQIDQTDQGDQTDQTNIPTGIREGWYGELSNMRNCQSPVSMSE